MSFEEIAKCIGDIRIGKVPVDPGLTNLRVETNSEEDSVSGEGKIVFDIKFNLFLDDGETKVIINVEAQKSTDPAKLGYEIDSRMIYYTSRLISS